MLVCVHDCVLMCVFTRWEHKHGHATAKHFSLYFPQGDLLPQWSDQWLTFILYYELILGNTYNSIIMQDIYNIHEHWYPLLVQSHMTGYELISVYVRMYVHMLASQYPSTHTTINCMEMVYAATWTTLCTQMPTGCTQQARHRACFTVHASHSAYMYKP